MSIKSFAKKFPFLSRFFKKTYINRKAADFKKISENAPVDRKLVVFESFQGRSYSCSPRAVYEYMISSGEFKDYRYVWVFRDVSAHGEFPANTSLVEFDSDESFRAYSEAGTWIVNSRLRDFLVPKEGQKYIQCWHGTPFKKIGCDVTCAGNATSTVEKIYSEYTSDAKKIYRLISPSDFTTQKLISAFNLEKLGKTDCIIQKGYPRNDRLFNTSPEDVEKIRSGLGIPDGKKAVLYCPTFRDNQYSSLGYTLKIGLDLDSLREKFGEDIVILFRAHYFIADKFDFEQYDGFVTDVSGCDDINELYLASDILITDYSSVFFDFANLNRPMIFYLYDFEEYRDKMRDFYFGTAMLPGITVHDQQKLEKALSDVLSDMKEGGSGLMRYANALKTFNRRFNPLEDGHSAERTVREIFGQPGQSPEKGCENL
ncbi:MAG: CDP-glycerol glycerophosphotransferase family protein [Porcipelethomonas sp.]